MTRWSLRRTNTLVAGVHIKVVSFMLGHANEPETLRIYIRYIPSQMADANAQIDAFYKRSRAQSDDRLESVTANLGGKYGLKRRPSKVGK